jgi:transposase
MGNAAGLTVGDEDRATLDSWSRSAEIGADLAQRARIVLAASEGRSNAEIATQLRVSPPTVWLWRARYAKQGLAGLRDAPRSGRPASIDPLAIVIATLAGPAPQLSISHWSSRRLAAQLGISNASVAKVWAAWKLKPWRTESFTLPTEPPLDANVQGGCSAKLSHAAAIAASRSSRWSSTAALPRACCAWRAGGTPR